MTKITSEQNIRELVLSSIRVNLDLKTLEDISLEVTPKEWTENQYIKRNINMYLDNYNNYIHEARLKYDGQGQFTVSGMTPNVARAYALWDTYIEICKDNHVSTKNWTFNPQQRKLQLGK